MPTLSGSPYALPKKARAFVPEGWIIPTLTTITSQESTGGFHTWTTPGTGRAGDLAIVSSTTRNSSNPGPSGGGWTTIWDFDTSSNERVGCWVKITTGSEPATYTQDPNGNGAGAYVVIRREGNPWKTFTSVGGYNDTLAHVDGIQTYAGGMWVGIWNGTYNGTVADYDFGSMVNAAHIQQSSDEFVSIHYQPVYETHYHGIVIRWSNASGYRTAGGLSVW